jgi:hypothetical protein
MNQKLRERALFRQVGSSTTAWAWDGSLAWTDNVFNTSTLRGFRHSLYTGVPWQWTAGGVTASVSYLSLCVLLLWTIRIGRPIRGSLICACTVYSGHLVHAAQCVACAAAGQTPMAITAGLVAFVDLLWPAGFVVREAWIRHVFGISGAGYALAVVHHYVCLIGQPSRILGSTYGFVNLYLWSGVPMVRNNTCKVR